VIVFEVITTGARTEQSAHITDGEPWETDTTPSENLWEVLSLVTQAFALVTTCIHTYSFHNTYLIDLHVEAGV
jgi:hypothetical protein